MPSKTVYVEFDPVTGKVSRIFRYKSLTLAFMENNRVGFISQARAVSEIREQVYEKSGGRCRNCGMRINGHFHMHELVPRSKGGEVSTDNSVALCAECHILRKDSAHGDRIPQFRSDPFSIETFDEESA